MKPNKCKKLKHKETARIQLHPTGRGMIYSVVLPIAQVREIERQTGREFKKQDRLTVTLLTDEPGWVVCPVSEEE